MKRPILDALDAILASMRAGLQERLDMQPTALADKHKDSPIEQVERDKVQVVGIEEEAGRLLLVE